MRFLEPPHTSTTSAESMWKGVGFLELLQLAQDYIEMSNFLLVSGSATITTHG